MKNLHLFSKTSKTILGALLFAGSLVIMMYVDSELGRQGNISVISVYEVK